MAQWVSPLRLELGHQLHPDPVRLTSLAPACSSAHEDVANFPSPSQGDGPPEGALRRIAGRFSGRELARKHEGTLRCPAGQSLVAHERRPEADGSLRVVDGASIGSCRPWPDAASHGECARQCHQKASPGQREARILSWLAQLLSCGGMGAAGGIDVPASSSCAERRVEVQHEHDHEVRAAPSPPALSRAQRAHSRLSLAERFVRNVRVSSASRPRITLLGGPETFSAFLGLPAT